jgi:hypothetical protein
MIWFTLFQSSRIHPEYLNNCASQRLPGHKKSLLSNRGSKLTQPEIHNPNVFALEVLAGNKIVFVIREAPSSLG